MKAPRFYLGAVVLFWGWQVHTLWLAIGCAVMLESVHMINTRFWLKPSDFNKFVDVSTILLAGTIVTALTIDAEKAILILLKWLPLIFFPIIAAQEFSANGKIDIRSFFLVGRKRVKLQFYEAREIDVSYIYSLFCLISAGTANTKGYLFYFFVVLFFVWALWQVRSRRMSAFLWAAGILAAVILGYQGQKTIRLTSMRINQWIMEYYADYYSVNPFKTSTALGDIGKLKFYDKIVLRVLFEDVVPNKTYLLQSATYNRFAVSNWFARFKFESIVPSLDNTFWQVNPFEENTGKMTVYFRLIRNKAVLSLPPGVVSISQMKAGACEKNALQSIRIEDGPALIKSIVSYTGKLSYDAKPDAHDVLVPKKELLGIAEITKELGLENKSEQEILKIVKHYFLTRFTYSLDLKGKETYTTPLQNFLHHTKAGHCEFFATATALILRQANIPARYVTGYIAHEYSRMENCLIVRQKDAHAWVKVYINGQWRNFDTTPPSFLEIDSQEIKTSLITDFFSFIGFKLSQLRHETGAKLMNQYGLWLILPLGILLFFRLRTSNKIKRARMSDTALEGKKLENRDILFYLIEDLMSQKGFPRYPYETYFSWIDRIGHSLDSSGINVYLHPLLLLHNRYRFSKSGLKEDEKKKFNADVKTLLEKLTKASWAS
ncbi:MAG: transglutaminase family protein [Proteobacteria bacterium]|nr:transglutaminase family protein [Pseudomonadota bacterium]MBU1581290.1 transglutaminase family protein [Pseudomonadota bacterium]MBU2455587.1 transglutaminase family protein [Pseudomonadota bacterium]